MNTETSRSRTEPAAGTVSQRRPLRATIAVTPSAGGCVVADVAPETANVRRSTTRREDCRSCQSEVTVLEAGETTTRYVQSSMTDDCICAILGRHDCVSELVGIRDGSLRFSLVMADRSTLQDVIGTIRETGATVKLERIRRGDAADGRTLELDADAITEKQREAVDLAIEAGYYETPRRADLADLADRLGVSKSAVSQRLNAVETTLVSGLATADDAVVR